MAQDPLMPDPDDEELLELAEDPHAAPSEPRPTIRPGIEAGGGSGSGGGSDDDAADPPADGDEPAYVNPEVARVRREEQRIAAALEQAEAEARKKKIMFGVAGGVVALLIVLYIVIF